MQSSLPDKGPGFGINPNPGPRLFAFPNFHRLIKEQVENSQNP